MANLRSGCAAVERVVRQMCLIGKVMGDGMVIAQKIIFRDHHAISQAPKMSAVAELLRKNIAGVDDPSNVSHLDSVKLLLLTDKIFF